MASSWSCKGKKHTLNKILPSNTINITKLLAALRSQWVNTLSSLAYCLIIQKCGFMYILNIRIYCIQITNLLENLINCQLFHIL